MAFAVIADIPAGRPRQIATAKQGVSYHKRGRIITDFVIIALIAFRSHIFTFSLYAFAARNLKDQFTID